MSTASIRVDEFAYVDGGVLDVQEAMSYSDTIPPGLYRVAIVGNELIEAETQEVPTRRYNVLELQFVIREPSEMEGRKLSARYRMLHPVERIRNINMKMFSEVCHAAGVNEFKTTSQILQRELMVTVTEREYNGRMYNDISKAEPLEGLAKLKADAAAQQSSSAPPAPPAAPVQQANPNDLDF